MIPSIERMESFHPSSFELISHQSYAKLIVINCVFCNRWNHVTLLHIACCIHKSWVQCTSRIKNKLKSVSVELVQYKNINVSNSTYQTNKFHRTLANKKKYTVIIHYILIDSNIFANLLWMKHYFLQPD